MDQDSSGPALLPYWRPEEILASAGYWRKENATLEYDQTELFSVTHNLLKLWRTGWKPSAAAPACG